MANLTKVVMHRYNHQLPLMVTSNLSFGEIEARFGKDGDAVTGRLREMARGFVVEGFGELGCEAKAKAKPCSGQGLAA